MAKQQQNQPNLAELNSLYLMARSIGDFETARKYKEQILQLSGFYDTSNLSVGQSIKIKLEQREALNAPYWKQLFSRFISGLTLGFFGSRPKPEEAAKLSPMYREINIPVLSPLYKFLFSEYGISPAGLAEGIGFFVPSLILRPARLLLKGGAKFVPVLGKPISEFLEKDLIKSLEKGGLWFVAEKGGYRVVDTIAHQKFIQEAADKIASKMSPKVAGFLGGALRKGLALSIPAGFYYTNWDIARKQWEGQPVERSLPLYVWNMINPIHLVTNTIFMGLPAEALERALRRGLAGKIPTGAEEMEGYVYVADYMKNSKIPGAVNILDHLKNLENAGNLTQKDLADGFAQLAKLQKEMVNPVTTENMAIWQILEKIDNKQGFIPTSVRNFLKKEFFDFNRPFDEIYQQDPDKIKGFYAFTHYKFRDKFTDILKKEFGWTDEKIKEFNDILGKIDTNFNNKSDLLRQVYDKLISVPELRKSLFAKPENVSEYTWLEFLRNQPLHKKVAVAGEFIDNIYSKLPAEARKIPEINKYLEESPRIIAENLNYLAELKEKFGEIYDLGLEKNYLLMGKIWDDLSPATAKRFQEEVLMKMEGIIENLDEIKNADIKNAFTSEEWTKVGKEFENFTDTEGYEMLMKYGIANSLRLSEAMKWFLRKHVDRIPENPEYSHLQNLELLTSDVWEKLKNLGEKPKSKLENTDKAIKEIVNSLEKQLSQNIKKQAKQQAQAKYHPLTETEKQKLANDMTELIMNEKDIIGKAVENASTPQQIEEIAENIKNMRRVVPPEILNNIYRKAYLLVTNPDDLVTRFIPENEGAELLKYYKQLGADGKAQFYISLLGELSGQTPFIVGYRLYMDDRIAKNLPIADIKAVALKDLMGIPLNQQERQIKQNMINWLVSQYGTNWMDRFEEFMYQPDNLRKIVQDAVVNGYYTIANMDEVEVAKIVRSILETEQIQTEGFNLFGQLQPQ